MSWKSRYPMKSNSASKQEWAGSRDDNRTYWRSRRRDVPQPASSANEALWRVAKRIGTTYRWLKVDLSLLADLGVHGDLLSSWEHVLTTRGSVILPDLGSKPIDANIANRPEVVELVSIFGSLLPKDKVWTTKNGMGVQHNVAQVQHKSYMIAPSVSVQTKGEYMVRFDINNLKGQWKPLDASSCKRGAVIRCKSDAGTNAEGVDNMSFSEGQSCKILSQDDEQELRIVALTELDTCNLWEVSSSRWLFRSSFNKFEMCTLDSEFSE